MHCPSCGQQQVSGETKFCSRCGMPLTLVAEVLANGGFLPQLAELDQKKTLFNKKNGVTFGIIWLIFFSMFATAFLGILDAWEALIGISAVTGIFGAMIMIIGSLTLLPSSKPKLKFPVPAQSPSQSLYGSPQGQQALPPQQSLPVPSYGRPGSWRDTNDLQPSVTESTTRLLSDDERQ